MMPKSNILRFSSLFHIAYSIDADSQAIERIFGKRHINKKKYKENTTLQKNAKKHLLNGGKLGIGIGFIDRFMSGGENYGADVGEIGVVQRFG